jgi:hypothetical protein
MSEPVRLHFSREGRLTSQLPERCDLFFEGYEGSDEVGQAVAIALEHVLGALAITGMDLRALDGITLSSDCRQAATALQGLPEGQIPLEMGSQPETMEMARTVAVWRGDELRFHIVLRAGVGLMTLSPEKTQQALARACIAHEAAHVEHEGHLYRTFPGIYGRPLQCGNRSRQTFLKAMDVWSEYAACRSSAMFRPEAVQEFEGMFCRALRESLSVCKERTDTFRRDADASRGFNKIHQLFGDVFICAGYFLGHLDGLDMQMQRDAQHAVTLLQEYPHVESLFVHLRCALHELWLTESNWGSIEVFAPIYDLICAMMALHQLSFARDGDDWHIVMSESGCTGDSIQDAFDRWVEHPQKTDN